MYCESYPCCGHDRCPSQDGVCGVCLDCGDSLKGSPRIDLCGRCATDEQNAFARVYRDEEE